MKLTFPVKSGKACAERIWSQERISGIIGRTRVSEETKNAGVVGEQFCDLRFRRPQIKRASNVNQTILDFRFWILD